MIRYVLAVLLTVALLGLAIPALDHGSYVNSKQQVESNVAAIDEAATSLAEQEEPSPDGHPPPRRTLTVTLPKESLTSTAVDNFEIERHGSASVASFYFGGKTENQIGMDQPIVYGSADGNETVEFGGTGRQRIALTLEEGPSGDPVVVVNYV